MQATPEPTEQQLGSSTVCFSLVVLAMHHDTATEMYQTCGETPDMTWLLQAVYQAEALVDVLVRTRAHNYVEFKAVDARCVHTQHGVAPEHGCML